MAPVLPKPDLKDSKVSQVRGSFGNFGATLNNLSREWPRRNLFTGLESLGKTL